MAAFPLVAVAVATLATFMAGGLWYGPLFGKAWQARQNWSEADKARAKAGMGQLFATTLVCEAVVASVLVHVLGQIPHDPAITLMVTLGTAVGFVIPALAVNYGYAQKQAMVLAIDAGHWLLVFLTMGLIFVAFRV